MNDEVSVTELLQREGWTEPERAPRSRMQVMAVMLAVVLGCGLAAILVKIGADTQADDQAAIFSMPHGPTGGLAGGGVPGDSGVTERTNSSSRVVVTNESPGAEGGSNGIPWSTKARSRTQASTITVTDSAEPPTSSTEPAGPGGPTDPGQTGTAPGDSTTSSTSSSSRTQPSCVLIIICRP